MKAIGQQVEAGDLRVRLEVLAWTAARHGHDDLAAHLFGAMAAAWDAMAAAHPLVDPRQYDQARDGAAPAGRSALWSCLGRGVPTVPRERSRSSGQ